MGWQANYRQAQFRTAEFFVPDSDVSGGRRAVVHEFPQKEIPFVEDMGRKARQFSIDAYVLGDDYMVGRDALIEALEKSGPGKLVHPYYGTIDVVCQSWSVHESRGELRFAKFSLSFVEAGVLVNPTIVVDTSANVALKKTNALDKVKAWLAKAYNVARVPHSVMSNVVSSINKGLSVIEDAKKVVSAVSDFRRDLDNMKGKAIQLAFDVQDLAQEFADALTFGTNEGDSFPASPDNARAQFNEMQSMFDFVPDDIVGSSDPSEIFASYIQQNAVINALGLTSIMTFDSVEDANNIREIVLTKLEEFLLSTIDDELYKAYYELSTSVIFDIDTRAKTLARVAEYTAMQHISSLVLAYNLYGAIDNEQDIIDRNRLSNPAFIPAAVPIEVLVYE